MANTDFRSVDEYIESLPEHVQPVVQRVLGTLRKALPSAQEVISYQIPALRTDGGIVLYFAGWKEHISIYPVTDALMASFGDELRPYRASKGTLRFPLDRPMPVRLIARVAKFRAADVAERATARRAAAARSKKK
ncbi:MAG: iron chaperone [Ilumatobacteraceae bacterium]